MAEHLPDEISIERLAELADLSPSHFADVFKETTGMTPLQFITRQRITRAQQLMRETSRSVIEIGLEVSTKRKEVGMEITRAGSQPSTKGPGDWFTGTTRIDPLFQPKAPARSAAASVTFEPGARTAWHTHPLGQTLIVTSGCGLAQRENGPVQEIRPGDVVWFPPGEKHWHGAAPTTAMTHIAIQEVLDGKVVDWIEKVTDEQYSGGAKA